MCRGPSPTRHLYGGGAAGRLVRAVGRVAAPQHGSLTDVLTPFAKALRLALGNDETILVAFDRGGAFADQMAELRDAGFEFVTYERRPFPRLMPISFSRTIHVDGEELGLHESNTNLGKGRGRLRRIALRTPDGRQVNLLAKSTRPVEQLASILRHRWNQENGFKHGVVRWGINQLDGRAVEPYEPGTVIPNPARRRLDRALKLVRSREGQVRNELARLDPDSPERAELGRELAEALEDQQEL